MAGRRFEFSEGTSNKFWEIDVAGASHTVTYGKIGTAGTAKTKAFADAAAARKDADKLIAEKTGKGYAEVGGGPAPAAPAAATPAAKPKAKKKAADDADAEPEPAKAATPDPPPAAAPVPTATGPVTRAVTLTPADRAWVTYGEREVPPQPAKKAAFDLKKATAALKKSLGDWKHASEIKALADTITAAHFLEFLPVLMGGSAQNAHWLWRGENVLDVVREEVLPYLSDLDRAAAAGLVRPALANVTLTHGGYNTPPLSLYLAALLGLHDDIRAVVEALPDDAYTGQHNYSLYYHQPQRLVFGLGSRELVERHFRRLKLPLFAGGGHVGDYARGWFAHAGLGGLDVFRESALKLESKGEAAALVRALNCLDAPEVAPVALELSLESRAPGEALKWLRDHPACAIAGLIPVAAGAGKLAKAAQEMLRELDRAGHRAALEARLAETPDHAAAVKKHVLDAAEPLLPVAARGELPDPVRAAFDAVKSPKPAPEWADAAGAPAVVVAGKRLGPAEVTALLHALKAGTAGDLAAALKAHADPASLDAFGWHVFERWQREGGNAKEKWAVTGLAHTGGDRTALRLTPLVREWPGEGQHQRAVAGLEVLRAIGTDTALMCLNGVAQKVKYAGIKDKAGKMMEQVAQDRNLTPDELADRIVPTLDLDAKGGRAFDFGPRQFTLVLDADLKPLVREADGKPRGDLPKPNAQDDAAKAAGARDEWKLLKKQLAETLKAQTARLEQGMVTGRAWPVAVFEAVFVRHPVMTHLARRIVWAGQDAKGKRVTLFRVTEEQDYTDAADKAVTLDGVASVAVVHPLHMAADEKAAWGDLFSDYEVIPPFPQLGRPVFTPTDAEKGETELKRFGGVKIFGMTIWGMTEKRGWRQDGYYDGGVLCDFRKHYPAAGVTAQFDIDPGIYLGDRANSPDSEITRCRFYRGSESQYRYHGTAGNLKLGDVDPVAFSETAMDLAALAAKGT